MAIQQGWGKQESKEHGFQGLSAFMCVEAGHRYVYITEK
jgi:hypothetical protein